MRRILFPVLIVVFAAILGTAAYLVWQSEPDRQVELPPIAEAPPVPAEPTEPRYPIPPIASDADASAEGQSYQQAGERPVETLPELNQSSPVLEEKLSDLAEEGWIPELFKRDEIIRRFVVTIDNLPNKKLPRQYVPVNRAEGPFLTAEEDQGRVISPINAARYTPYVKLAQNLDAEQLVALYVRFYPLFQEAYAELGNPNAYFNDRLVAVIDHLLDTPTVEEPLPLVRPKVFYEYADPELEELSAGQKILLRMGKDNAEQIKVKLRELRQALVKVSRQ